LNGFEPVSMKMAKEQSLFLNPLKFSGICGKLMCCLKYEYAVYKEAKSRLPAVGASVETADGVGKVVEINVIKETFAVEMEGGAVVHCSTADLEVAAERCPAAEVGCGGCEAFQAESPEVESAPASAPEHATAEQVAETHEPQPGQPGRSGRRRRRRSGSRN
jgi:hypothetical protein